MKNALIYVSNTTGMELLIKKIWKTGCTLIVSDQIYRSISEILGLVQGTTILQSQRIMPISSFQGMSDNFLVEIYKTIGRGIDLIVLDQNLETVSLVRTAVSDWKTVSILLDSDDYQAYLTQKIDDNFRLRMVSKCETLINQL